MKDCYDYFNWESCVQTCLSLSWNIGSMLPSLLGPMFIRRFPPQLRRKLNKLLWLMPLQLKILVMEIITWLFWQEFQSARPYWARPLAACCDGGPNFPWKIALPSKYAAHPTKPVFWTILQNMLWSWTNLSTVMAFSHLCACNTPGLYLQLDFFLTIACFNH